MNQISLLLMIHGTIGIEHLALSHHPGRDPPHYRRLLLRPLALVRRLPGVLSLLQPIDCLLPLLVQGVP